MCKEEFHLEMGEYVKLPEYIIIDAEGNRGMMG